VVDDYLGFTTPFVKTVGYGGSCRLVDDTKDLETGNGTSFLGSLALSVVEVGGNGNDGMSDLLSKVSLCGLLHLGQDHGGNLFGSKFPLFSTVPDRNRGLSTLLNNLEWPT
jgi:hypothetical protein